MHIATTTWTPNSWKWKTEQQGGLPRETPGSNSCARQAVVLAIRVRPANRAYFNA